MITSQTGAPRDYAELYEHYFPMIRSIVSKAGISNAEVEDVSMDLLTKFMEKDALSWYDPNLLHDVGNRPRLEGERLRPAKFQGLLRRFCTLYVRQHLDKQALRSRREPHRLEDRVGETTWAEAHGEELSEEPHIRTLEAHSLRHTLTRTADLLEAEHHEWSTAARQAPSKQASVHAERRAAEALRARQALITAHELAIGKLHVENCGNPSCTCERVTSKNVAVLNGWSTSTASSALRMGRAQLRLAVS